MRRITLLEGGWQFAQPGQPQASVTLPHTWNAVDGQDGGNDYLRCACTYQKQFAAPAFDLNTECVYLEFEGVNASAVVTLNGVEVCRHDGGYSTFRAEITPLIAAVNELCVKVDNSVNDTVYPQKADFTFYGGIYRPVKVVVVNKQHFSLGYFGGSGLKITAAPDAGYRSATVKIDTWHNVQPEQGGQATVKLAVLDAAGAAVATGSGENATLHLDGVHLWNGVTDPYLYTAVATLVVDGAAVDEVRSRFGVRDFKFDENSGFWLNGKAYPLHGVSRHQDRRGAGNAISEQEHREDMALIAEIGANTIRLAHYQHSQFFYDLCDEAGMVVWAEIPYISEHMPNGRANTISQMTELIVQNYNHPCIVTWGISNEITISTKDHADMMDNHRQLNDLIHRLDPTRPTTLACYAMCLPWDGVVHKVSDLVGYNLYLGWYVPGLWLNDAFFKLFHLLWPKRRLCYSEYGAEGMPNLHSARPRRGDHTEEYQAVYHEYMLKCFARYPWLWASYVWNMFDFAADARDQGGEPGMNHKGLVTFDRKTKKDSFYLYKAYWSASPVVHIAGKRRAQREEAQTTIKVYSNQPKVALYVNGRLHAEQSGDKVFAFKNVPLAGEIAVEARTAAGADTAVFTKVETANPAYTLVKSKSKSANWV